MRKLGPREGQVKSSQAKGESASQPRIPPTQNSMFRGWELGPWRSDPSSPQEDQARKTDRRWWRSKKPICYNLAPVKEKSWAGRSQPQGRGWPRRLEQLWSSAVWKTSDFVVLVYYDNKSQLPHSAGSHQPPPEMDK